MSITDIETLLPSCTAGSPEAKVYRIFTRQPTQIGTHKDNLVPLDLSNETHRVVFLTAVEEDFVQLLAREHYTEHQILEACYRHALKLITPI